MPMILLSVIVFFVMFSFLILIHEAGHFFAARWSGVKVLEFGLGFGKTLWKKTKGETDYTFNAIPFGGFVRMLGEEESSEDPRSFEQAKLWKRMAITLAGIFMNAVFCIAALTGLFMSGTNPLLVEDTPEAITVAEEKGWVTPGPILSDEYAADLATRIETSFDPTLAGLYRDMWTVREDKPARKVISDKINDTYFAQWDTFSDDQKQDWTYMISSLQGTQYPELKLNKITLPFTDALHLAVTDSWRLSKVIVSKAAAIPAELIKTRQVPEGLAGPVGIAEITHQVTTSQDTVSGGFKAIMKLAALLSLSLAVMNLLPLPALDGGRFLFQIIELVTQRKVPAKWEQYLHIFGFLFLMSLLVIITFNDIFGLIKRYILAA